MDELLKSIGKFVDDRRAKREELERIEREREAEAERLEQERIQAEKDAMATMSERELLIEMVSLARETKRGLTKLGKRFDEFESFLESIDPDLYHEYEIESDDDEDEDEEEDSDGGFEIKIKAHKSKSDKKE